VGYARNSVEVLLVVGRISNPFDLLFTLLFIKSKNVEQSPIHSEEEEVEEYKEEDFIKKYKQK